MLPDPDRLTAALSALAGGIFWGLFQVATMLLAGQPLGEGAVFRALANVAVGLLGGVLAAYFLAVSLAPMIPFASLRDLHAVGFAIGAGSWEVAPFVYRWLTATAAKRAKVEGQG